MGFMVMIIVGALVGWLACVIKPSPGISLMYHLVVGVVGAYSADLIVGSFTPYGAGWRLVISVIGAVLGVVILRWLSAPLASPHLRRAKR